MITRQLTKCALLGFVAICLFGCGGGGGSSAGPPPPTGSTGGGGAGGGTGGGTGATGGGASGGVAGGLIPGGASIVFSGSGAGISLDVASGGSGAMVSFGDAQGFGSVILNDVTVNTDNADFTVEGASGSQADLKQGQQLLVVADASGTTANGVHYRSNVKGPVTTVTIIDAAFGTANFVVLGQVVRTDATTAYSNVNLADITTANLLEVSGTLNSSGEIQASFVELKSTLAEYKVTGIASSTTGTNFVIGGLTVDYSSATLQDFDGPIADDDVIEAKGDASAFTAPDQFVASRVELLPALTVGANVPARIEGFVDRFASSADFDVQTAPVSADSNTTYVNGSAASIGLNVKVQVEGTFDANGTLLAQKITIQPTTAIRAEGHAEAIDVAARTISVLGVTFLTRDLTRIEDKSSVNQDPFGISDIVIGDELEIRGYLDGTQVVATRVERDDPRDRARLRGPVTAEDAAAGTVDVLSITLTGQSGMTEYQDVNDVVITQAEFHNAVELGTFVKGDWDVFVDTSQTVDELSIEN